MTGDELYNGAETVCVCANVGFYRVFYEGCINSIVSRAHPHIVCITLWLQISYVFRVAHTHIAHVNVMLIAKYYMPI